ncbi:MAG: hypothetical protein K6T63_11480 [Alicyclobacillus herbarius]|uniref:hypothetical protein n=1 Tax=Alicyclobacillus herbarius TaxID=122960 RepID=UPI0023543524|nr:hypothetical protein [Alicyclobacillus herbarius]MCL6633238.1 hypothetical protein [Alicyclobacillus herbarius]
MRNAYTWVHEGQFQYRTRPIVLLAPVLTFACIVSDRPLLAIAVPVVSLLAAYYILKISTMSLVIHPDEGIFCRHGMPTTAGLLERWKQRTGRIAWNRIEEVRLTDTKLNVYVGGLWIPLPNSQDPAVRKDIMRLMLDCCKQHNITVILE